MKHLPAGTRVRINHCSSWPERVGCTGVVVDPPDHHTYPAGFARYEVLVLLDEDPLSDRTWASYRERYGARYDHDRGWTCVINSNEVDELERVDDQEQTP